MDEGAGQGADEGSRQQARVPGPPLSERGTSRGWAVGGWVTAAVAAVVALTLVAGGVGILPSWLPSWTNPFRDTTTERTGASVLQSLTDLSDYHAASGHYETVVDIDQDTGFLPDFVSGERILYVGKGDVDAVVDFGELDGRRVELSEDGRTATITLPAPVTGTPTLDLDGSYVAYQDSGIVNRLRGSDLERQAQRKAVAQMAATAAGSSLLVERAEENTRAMLQGLLGALGYTDVTVTFEEPDAR